MKRYNINKDAKPFSPSPLPSPIKGEGIGVIRPEWKKNAFRKTIMLIRQRCVEDYKRIVMAIKKRQSGFTLVEIITVIGIIAALVGTITPLAFQVVGARREQATRDELQVIKNAIIGQRQSTRTGKEATFGFVGDIGTLPSSLDALRSLGSLPAFSFDSTLKMGAGWNGPYIMEKFGGDFKLDPYGNEYQYSTSPYVSTALGVNVLAKVTSMGPDGTSGTSDDLNVEILEPETKARVTGFTGHVRDSTGVEVSAVEVKINYPQNGSLTSSTTQTNAAGLYQFSDIPIGDRIITIDPKLLYKSNSGFSIGPTGKDVEFFINNFSENNISITSLTATYSTSPAAYYRQVKINGVSVRNSETPRAASGDTVSFAAITVSRSTVAKEPFLVRIQSSVVQAPDITITSRLAGGSLKIELIDFKDAPTGAANPVDMTGVPFTITFSNGSVVRFTPLRK